MNTWNLGHALLFSTATICLMSTSSPVLGGDPIQWNKERAGQYLDERGKTWFAFTPADRGTGPNKTTCVSCHTLVPYALARPVLRNLSGLTKPTEFEVRLIAQTKQRVEHWNELDSPKFGLLYNFDEQKKKESWGTESISNALILAFDDLSAGRKMPSESTKKAFKNLWQTQAAAGDKKGSWDWLDFSYEPWESGGARYFGAALAAIAIGSAPNYYTPGKDVALDVKVGLLRGFLRNQYARQNLFNRVWTLWASAYITGLLSNDEQSTLIKAIVAKQRADGGWSLTSLGTFTRKDGTAQPTESDGYATGLILHALQTAGVQKKDAALAKGLAWLATNQTPTGEWLANSMNKKRNPASHVGKFMSDAATAYAILALSHE